MGARPRREIFEKRQKTSPGSTSLREWQSWDGKELTLERRMRRMSQPDRTSYAKSFDRKKCCETRSLRSWEKQVKKESRWEFPGDPVVKTPRYQTSLVAQWLRICLPMHGTRVRALVWEDPTRHGATKPVCHNYWACALEPTCHNYWSPRT